MVKYLRNQGRLKTLPMLSESEPACRAVEAVLAGKAPNAEDVATLHDWQKTALFSDDPYRVFAGVTAGRGRPANCGFTPDIVFSARIEQCRRQLGGGYGSLSKAKKLAAKDFADVPDEGAERQIERDWASGRKVVETLDDFTLAEILAPYKQK